MPTEKKKNKRMEPEKKKDRLSALLERLLSKRGLLFIIAFAMVGAGLVYLTLAQETQFIVYPSDDTYAKEENYWSSEIEADQNFNWAKTIRASDKTAGCTTGKSCNPFFDHQGYLKFNVSNISADQRVKSVILRMRVNDPGPIAGTIYKAASDSWNENSLTWNNKPGITGSALAVNNLAVKRGSWIDFNLSTDAITGNGTYSFVVVGRNQDIVGYDTKETPNKPQLIITTETITPPADTTAPATLITSPGDGTPVNGTVPINANASDNIGVTKVEFYINNGKVSETTTSPYSYGWNTTATPDGNYTLQTRAYDAAGNIGYSTPLITVAVNNTTSSLIWSDEFNGTTLDSTRWKAYYNNYGATNGQLNCNTPNNLTISNGTLKITARKETLACSTYGTYNWTSGFIGSREASTSRYYPVFAKYEIRARLPHGQGLWPAFWLRHKNGSSTAEIDIMEYFHSSEPGRGRQSLHLPNEGGYNLVHKSKYFESVRTGTGGWHTFAVEISPVNGDTTKATLNYYIDGVLHYSYTPASFNWLNNFDKNAMFDIAVNMAVGGKWAGDPEKQLGYYPSPNVCSLTEKTPLNGDPTSCPIVDSWHTPVETIQFGQIPALYEVDYVRVYQLK